LNFRANVYGSLPPGTRFVSWLLFAWRFRPYREKLRGITLFSASFATFLNRNRFFYLFGGAGYWGLYEILHDAEPCLLDLYFR